MKTSFRWRRQLESLKVIKLVASLPCAEIGSIMSFFVAACRSFVWTGLLIRRFGLLNYLWNQSSLRVSSEV